MTQREAKKLTLKVWSYLAAHPECTRKCQVPPALYSRVESFLFGCPLCELFVDADCDKCPLKLADKRCMIPGSAFDVWRQSHDNAGRQQAAARILRIVSEWKPEGAAHPGNRLVRSGPEKTRLRSALRNILPAFRPVWTPRQRR